MRHFLANVAVYTIATILLGAAALFGWIRHAQLTLGTESTLLARHEPAASAAFDWRELGARGYERNCANCHGARGEGWDQYPAIGHTSALYAVPGGRDYVIDLHLYGLTSPRWRAPMPPMGHMQDVEMAAVINHVLTHYGNERVSVTGPLLGPADVAARRGQGLKPADVDARRPGGGR